jgi:hypothetical protein
MSTITGTVADENNESSPDVFSKNVPVSDVISPAEKLTKDVSGGFDDE